MSDWRPQVLTRRTETSCKTDVVGAASGRLGREQWKVVRSRRLGMLLLRRQMEAWNCR